MSFIDFMIETTKHQSVLTQEAHTMMQQIYADIEGNERNLGDMLDSINDISLASQKNEEIVAFLQGIAEKTKILSLNASIEAARTGTYGGGFQAIAREMHGLANKSHEATTKSVKLVYSSREKAGLGMAKVQDMENTLRDMYNKMKSLYDQLDRVSFENASHVEQLEQVRPYAVAINLAGRQRMLSQKMVKEFLLTQIGFETEANQKQFNQSMELFERTLIGLKHGDPGQGLLPTDNPKILRQLTTVETLWTRYKELIETYTPSRRKKHFLQQLQPIAELSQHLLTESNKVVELYEQQAS